jgi:hypothetical protein
MIFYLTTPHPHVNPAIAALALDGMFRMLSPTKRCSDFNGPVFPQQGTKRGPGEPAGA